MIVSINQDLCKACGICGHICPRHIPETKENGGKKITTISMERIDLCMTCGHCVAVCPNDAIQVNGLSSRDYDVVKDLVMDEDQILTLMRQRRSVRRYKDKPIPREITEKIIAAAQSAPTGTGQSKTGVIVIDNPQTLGRFSELVYELYEKLESGLKNPIAHFFIKRSTGEKRVRTLQDFVMPGTHWYIRWYRDGKSNEILRDCPVLMLFHSPINEPVNAENCLIAAFHAILMAQVLELAHVSMISFPQHATELLKLENCWNSLITVRFMPVSQWGIQNINSSIFLPEGWPKFATLAKFVSTKNISVITQYAKKT